MTLSRLARELDETAEQSARMAADITAAVELLAQSTDAAEVQSRLGGVVMALQRRQAACEDGTYFAEGTTDFTCYVHPQGALGIAIAAISVLLGILVVFANISTRASLRARRPSA